MRVFEPSIAECESVVRVASPFARERGG